MDNKLEWYLDKIVHEINYEIKKDTRFCGNIEFKINIRNGQIANMNVGNNKSIKMSKEIKY